ncbi:MULTISPECIES: hypothetical protein [unclassified Microcoleus]|uniref:hypothetical protein n=1 Tax=unclassified Microcoleus TaxID=2642155 RepID=UPI002FCFFAF6
MVNVNFNVWGNKDENKIVASIPSTLGSDGSIILNSPLSILSNQPIRSIDTNQKTYVITHGFQNTGGNQGNNYAPSLSEIAIALRSQPENANANIILVDWEEGAKPQGLGGYVIPAQNTREVGNQIAQFLNKQGIDPNKTELIGHSLGAHVSGFAGAKYKELTGNELNRIPGLDPAGPEFETRITRLRLVPGASPGTVISIPEVEPVPPSDRLDPDDAKRVVAIHTSRTLGHDEAIGDFDVFITALCVTKRYSNSSEQNNF